MWNCLSRKPVYTRDTRNEIICDLSGNIISINDDAQSLLLYERPLLIGKFIGVIMSPFMAYLHYTVLFPKYRNSSPFQKNVIHLFLAAKTMKRPLLIYDIHKNPLFVSISVALHSETWILSFDVIQDTNNLSVYLQMRRDRNPPIDFTLTNNYLVIIAMDYMNTSKYITDYSELNKIELHKRFHNDLVRILKTFFYPYINIYEIRNTGCILVANACWTYNMPRYCASLVMSFLREFYNQTCSYITLRAGVAYEKAYVGYIDTILRLFGKPMEMSAKYMEACGENEICIDLDLLDKIKRENIYNDVYVYDRAVYIDGARYTRSCFVDISKVKDPFSRGGWE